MGVVFSNISVSLDGFTTGPDDDPKNPMGIGGERLHDWMFRDELLDHETRAHVDTMFDTVGAVIVGRRMFDLGFEPWGHQNPFGKPLFVVTHRARGPIEHTDRAPISFVESFETALARSRTIAGDLDILIGGGAAIHQQALASDTLDEIRTALIPVLMGSGRPLFAPAQLAGREFEITCVRPTPAAIHITYRRKP
jgi:dihydrofolate reductase